MSDPGRRTADEGAPLRLTCRPGREGSVLTFPYTLENLGSVDIYAMHALPSVDSTAETATANENCTVVILGADGDAIIGKFAAPLPTDRRVAIPVLPLARRLPPQGSLEGRLDVPLPLAETSPYFADLRLREYEIIEIRGIVLTIGFWADAADGLTATPAEYAPELFNITTRNTFRSARRVFQRFPTSALQLFKRSDAFPRTFG